MKMENQMKRAVRASIGLACLVGVACGGSANGAGTTVAASPDSSAPPRTERVEVTGAFLPPMPVAVTSFGGATDGTYVYVLGGYHDEVTRTNVCVVLGPEGLLWRQRKHIPAFLRAGSDWIAEPIETPPSPLYVVGATPLGRIAIAICRDFLDLELRVALKNSVPPVDILLNPAFSPVTADFQAAHFEARRALYACTVFCNFATFGDSRIESPEKSARTIRVPRGEERVEIVDVPLFAMRAERSAWDARAHGRFIQSTRQ